jgi:hypothetical protein
MICLLQEAPLLFQPANALPALLVAAAAAGVRAGHMLFRPALLPPQLQEAAGSRDRCNSCGMYRW